MISTDRRMWHVELDVIHIVTTRSLVFIIVSICSASYSNHHIDPIKGIKKVLEHDRYSRVTSFIIEKYEFLVEDTMLHSCKPWAKK